MDHREIGIKDLPLHPGIHAIVIGMPTYAEDMLNRQHHDRHHDRHPEGGQDLQRDEGVRVIVTLGGTVRQGDAQEVHDTDVREVPDPVDHVAVRVEAVHPKE